MHEHFWLAIAEQRGADLRAEAALGRRVRDAGAGRRRGAPPAAPAARRQRPPRLRLRGA
ncbi:hypothetical protein [Vallicoccus soli]|uniref:hypothetical protein n=1 Tax=Vallicoccus soli TaxID=2339232 RepID=UPI0014027124|nr:hypothetical protein [Vallicoccus soli]